MKTLPASPNLDHLKEQAKDLLRDARAGEPAALQRFIESLPAASGLTLAQLTQHELKLHDAQSVLAREFGFKSWLDLRNAVEWKRSDRAQRLKTWFAWAYSQRPSEYRYALRILREDPGLFTNSTGVEASAFVLATGDATALAAILAKHGPQVSTWVNQPIGPLQMPPLIAVTHSQLIRDAAFESGLLACAAILLNHGANPNATWTNPEFPDWPLSALYGAAGFTHNPAMTRLLLAAGANPDDNESLYHSVEAPDPACTHLLLEAGARVVGTNAIGRVLDYDKLDLLKQILQQGLAQPARPLIRHEIAHAILRGRSIAHIRVLLDAGPEAGVDLHATGHDGVSLYRYAQLHGRGDVLELLRQAGVTEPQLSIEDQFITACAQADETTARQILNQNPEIFARLTPKQLEALPELAAVGNRPAVRTMLALGWPLEIKTGWGATALNHAVYRGDAEMTALLLEAGADWRTRHDFNDNVIGTLAFASKDSDSKDTDPGDFVACARLLLTSGVPLPAFEGYYFSPEVEDYLDLVRFQLSYAKFGTPGTPK
jgi:ankyrin repeat protein